MEGDFCCLSHVSHMDICSCWWCRGKVSSPEHSAYREHGKTIHMGDSWLSVRQEWLLGVSGLKSPCFRLHKEASCFGHRKRFLMRKAHQETMRKLQPVPCENSAPGLQEIPYPASECQLMSWQGPHSLGFYHVFYQVQTRNNVHSAQLLSSAVLWGGKPT